MGDVGKIRTFRDIIAWQKAMSLARHIYSITKRMPPDERFGLTNQMRRAAVSVPSNIAEGYGRGTRLDYIRFLRTARGSLSELDTQLELAWQLEFLPSDEVLKALMNEAACVLQSLITALERKED